VIHKGHIYQVNLMGFAECRELQTGRTVWEERLTGTGARNASWSAPVLAGDRLYLPNKNADAFVLRASTRFECLATNSIGGEPMNASLAVSDGEMFIRTDNHLWCISYHESSAAICSCLMETAAQNSPASRHACQAIQTQRPVVPETSSR